MLCLESVNLAHVVRGFRFEPDTIQYATAGRANMYAFDRCVGSG